MVCIAGVVVAAFSGPAEAAKTAGLVETRERVQQLTQELSDAETRLSQLQLEANGAVTQAQLLQAEVDGLMGEVESAAITDFVEGPSGSALLDAQDVTSSIRAEVLADAAIGHDTESLEDFRGLFEDLALAKEAVDASLAAQDQAVSGLREKRVELGEQLERLEELERERIEAERRRAAEVAAAEAARKAAGSGGSGGRSGGRGSGGGGSGASSGTLQFCPVGGAVSFIDSWGFPRSGGRRHKGVDMMASTGTPVVAPVGGSVTHRSNSVGGRSFHLNGNDGNYYYGTHLSGYGENGSVSAGTIIGYVGDDGNAAGMPHLHFEIHPGGGGAVNPYPAVRSAC